jgi:hypothetical protein
MKDGLCSSDAGQRQTQIVANHGDRLPPPSLSIGPGCVVHGNDTERIFLVQKQVAELGFADARRIGQDGFEHWLQFARRTGNDL